MVNQVIFSGEMYSDTKVYEKLAKFALLNVSTYRTKTETKEKKILMPCVVFGKLIEKAKGLKKGMKVVVVGEYSRTTYKDKNGETKFDTSVQVRYLYNVSEGKAPEAIQEPSNDYEEELPF